MLFKLFHKIEKEPTLPELFFTELTVPCGKTRERHFVYKEENYRPIFLVSIGANILPCFMLLPLCLLVRSISLEEKLPVCGTKWETGVHLPRATSSLYLVTSVTKCIRWRPLPPHQLWVWEACIWIPYHRKWEESSVQHCLLGLHCRQSPLLSLLATPSYLSVLCHLPLCPFSDSISQSWFLLLTRNMACWQRYSCTPLYLHPVGQRPALPALSSGLQGTLECTQRLAFPLLGKRSCPGADWKPASWCIHSWFLVSQRPSVTWLKGSRQWPSLIPGGFPRDGRVGWVEEAGYSGSALGMAGDFPEGAFKILFVPLKKIHTSWYMS